MFDNIGKKIKGVAGFVFILGSVASVVYGLGTMMSLSFFSSSYGSGILLGILIIGVGILLSWLSVLLIYGFGELIEKTTEIAKNTKDLADPDREIYTGTGRRIGRPESTEVRKTDQMTGEVTRYRTDPTTGEATKIYH